MGELTGQAVRTMLTAVRTGDVDEVSDQLRYWSGSEHGDDDFVSLVSALLAEGAQRIHELDPEAGAAFVLEVQCEGQSLDIDAVDPPVRAALRAQLAWLNGRSGDAEDQIRLVTLSGDRDDRLAMLVNSLFWAV